MVRLQFYNFTKARCSFTRLDGTLQQRSQKILRLRQIRLNFHRFAQFADRGVVLALRVQHLSEVVVSLSAAGVEGDRGAYLRDAFLKILFFETKDTEMKMRGPEICLQLNDG